MKTLAIFTLALAAAAPCLSTVAQETPVPKAQAPSAPAPITPAPITPAPITPTPITPTPITPAPNTPAPNTPAPNAVGHDEEKELTLERIALTEVPQADPNYALLGEFAGLVSMGENVDVPLGLQIRPIGNDRFEAIQFSGGLPGTGTVNGEAIPLMGRRSGDLVILSGGPWAIFVEHQHCLIVDREGNRVGKLARVERGSPTMGVSPPAEATVLFNGTGTEQFSTAQITPEGLLMAGADVNPMFQDFNLHLEFRLPYMPNSDGQQRGNSGCYIHSRYELQVLDSFALPPLFNGCSSIYRFKAPDINMCLPPLQWQTYDVIFTAPRWGADGKKLRNAHLSVWHNGIKTQDDVEMPDKTGAGKPEAPTLLPIRFQNHNDPVSFRNIWIVDRGLSAGNFPVYPNP